MLNALKKVGVAIGLGLNASVAAVGYFTGTLTTLGIAVEGRVFDRKSLLKAYTNMLRHTTGMMFNMVSNTAHSKYIELMKKYDIGTEFAASYKNSNQITALKVASTNWCFGMMRFFDFILKGTILNSTMLNYKYFNGKFYNKEQFKIEVT
ncbi:MAG: hypothetical protein EOM41_11735 [Bacilli bacterium]|nr:hypothetical protein [Bacilli bacterium]